MRARPALTAVRDRALRTALLAAVLLAAGPPLGAQPNLRGHPEHGWLRYALNRRAEPSPGELHMDLHREQALMAQGYGYAEQLIRRRIRMTADGHVVRTELHARRFLDAEGVRSGSELGVLVAADRERVVLEAAYAIAPDGVRTELDLSSIEVRAGEADALEDQREVIAPFAELRPGAVAVLAVTISEAVGDWPLPWSQRYALQLPAPIERQELGVQWEEGTPVPVLTENDPDLECIPLGRRGRFCARERTPARAIDSDGGSNLDRVPSLVVAQPQDWGELAARERRLVQAAAAPSARLSEWAQRLTQASATPRERAIALQRFVAEQIRTEPGPTGGASAAEPQPAELTLERGYGDAKDKVALFLALAALCELDAHAALVATEHFELGAVFAPSARYFDHMIACAPGLGAPGEALCLDVTDPYTPSGELAGRLVGAVALDLLPGAQPRLLREVPFGFRVQLSGSERLLCDGEVEERLELRYGGEGAGALRERLRALSAADRRRWAANHYASVMGNGAEPVFEVTGVDDASPFVSIRSRGRYAAGARWDGGARFREPEAWLVSHSAHLRSDHRSFAHRVPGLHVLSELEYQICEDRELGFAGAELDFHDAYGSLERSSERTARGVLVRSELSIPRRSVAAEDLPRFNRFLDVIGAHARIRLELRPSEAGR